MCLTGYFTDEISTSNKLFSIPIQHNPNVSLIAQYFPAVKMMVKIISDVLMILIFLYVTVGQGHI